MFEMLKEYWRISCRNGTMHALAREREDTFSSGRFQAKGPRPAGILGLRRLGTLYTDTLYTEYGICG